MMRRRISLNSEDDRRRAENKIREDEGILNEFFTAMNTYGAETKPENVIIHYPYDIEESSEDDFDSTVFHKFLDYFKQQISFFKTLAVSMTEIQGNNW